MALKATIFKLKLNIVDLDRNYYQDHELTLAQHPAETDARMMVRVLAFILNASETLSFSKGLSSEDDEAELWDKSLSDEINLWVAFGQSDEKWLRKAAGRAKQVQLFAYGGRSVPVWWQQNEHAFARYKNLKVINILEDNVNELALLAQRNMHIQCNISEGEIWLSTDNASVTIKPEILKDFNV
ncbi:YaeQ family protein [Algibacillus agarilyticus]|uniref:YaeQ family protein n=1 Tax=Algibacillus agarilyticus TaxID=2234133 RepID=UPI000DCFEC87|nr:YaeQ family protein [Algibacillus agarilyticus]